MPPSRRHEPTGRLAPVLRWTRRVMHEPWGELTRWQRAARFSVDLAVVGAQQLKQDRASQMAGALAFRTLFGLVPTLLVGTLLVRALGGFGDIERAIEERLAAMQTQGAVDGGSPTEADGTDAGRTSDASDAADVTEAAGGPEAASVTGTATGTATGTDADTEPADVMLTRFIATIVDAVGEINLTAITWAGVAVLAYAAISLMTTIETSFNVICRAPEGRPWSRRLPIYWTVLTLAPVLISLAAVVDHRVDEFLEATIAAGWLLRVAAIAWSLSLTTLLLTAVYKLVPSTSLPTRNTLVGAITATIAIEILKRSFGVYVEHATSLQRLTGSLGLVPLFMFWVYLLWLVVLFGLEVAQVLTRRSGRQLETMRSERVPSIIDPTAVLLVAGAVAGRFREGRSSDVSSVAAATNLPASGVQMMLDRLIGAGILHRLATEDDAVTFARPPEEVDAGELLRIGHAAFGGGDDQSEVDGVIGRLREAERAAARGITAATLGRQLIPQPAG